MDQTLPFTYSGFFRENKSYVMALELEVAQLHDLYTSYEDTSKRKFCEKTYIL